jgi:hypothetical protein
MKVSRIVLVALSMQGIGLMASELEKAPTLDTRDVLNQREATKEVKESSARSFLRRNFEEVSEGFMAGMLTGKSYLLFNRKAGWKSHINVISTVPTVANNSNVLRLCYSNARQNEWKKVSVRSGSFVAGAAFTIVLSKAIGYYFPGTPTTVNS